MSDRRALVTGAGSGIGRATAVRLASDGYLVVGLDRDADGLAETAEAVGAVGSSLVAAVADLAAPDATGELIAAHGDLDVVVNAAGTCTYLRLADTSVADLDRMLAVNVVGTFAVCRATAPGLARRGGAIVNVASAAGLNGRAYLSAYSASKGAVVALTRSLAVELAPDVRVNAVCPSAVDTPMVHALAPPAGADPALLARHPMLSGRRATPEEVAAAIAHLASPESGSTTGTAYLLDGGAAA